MAQILLFGIPNLDKCSFHTLDISPCVCGLGILIQNQFLHPRNTYNLILEFVESLPDEEFCPHLLQGHTVFSDNQPFI
jgi:hypothetical protein